MRFKLTALVLAGLSFLSAQVAKADTMQYNISGTLSDGSTVTGVVTVGSQGRSITYQKSDGTTSVSYTLNGGGGGGGSAYTSYFFGNGTAQVGALSLAFANPIGYVATEDSSLPFGSGALCTTVAPCGQQTSFVSNGFGVALLRFTSGTVTLVTPAAVSVTPEPSSLALIGTGVLGVVGVLRRRSL